MSTVIALQLQSYVCTLQCEQVILATRLQEEMCKKSTESDAFPLTQIMQDRLQYDPKDLCYWLLLNDCVLRDHEEAAVLWYSLYARKHALWGGQPHLHFQISTSRLVQPCQEAAT